MSFLRDLWREMPWLGRAWMILCVLTLASMALLYLAAYAS